MPIFYTIIDSSDYLPSEEFDWEKMMDIINSKLSPKFKACEGTFCPDVKFFLEAYNERPIFIPLDGKSPREKGQLFTLVDLKNDPEGYTSILTTDPTVLAEQEDPYEDNWYDHRDDNSLS